MRYLVNAPRLLVCASSDGIIPFIERGDWRKGEGMLAGQSRRAMKHPQKRVSALPRCVRFTYRSDGGDGHRNGVH